jgi:hypothetical protein
MSQNTEHVLLVFLILLNQEQSGFNADHTEGFSND